MSQKLKESLLEDLLILLSKRGVSSSMSDNTASEEIKKECPEEECTFSLNTMLGVALIGAVSSAGMYYIYTQLSKETKKALKDMVAGTVRSQMESCLLTRKEE